jgi:Ca2+-binding RTX toxin-like protein
MNRRAADAQAGRHCASAAAVSLAFLALLMFAGAAPASGQAPANDQFVNAIEVTGDAFAVSGANGGADRELGEPTHDGAAGGASVWWRWVASETRNVRLDTCGSSFDARVAAYTGSAVGTLTEAPRGVSSCGDGTAGWRIGFVATEGVTYHIAVEGFGATTGAIVMRLRPPPANDDFADAIELMGSMAAVTGSNDGAGPEVGEPEHPGMGGASVWYRWTAPFSGPAGLSTCLSESSKRVGVYTGASLMALVAVPLRTSFCGLQSASTFTALAGTTYHIAVDAPIDAPGDLGLTLAPSPPNNDFANATNLSGNAASVTATNVAADLEADEPVGLPGGSTVWWRWTAAERRRVTIGTCRSSFATILGVYTGAQLATLSKVAESNPSCGRVVFVAEPGVTYSIVVDGFLGASGTIALDLEAFPPPANDSFADAAVLSGGSVTAVGSTSNATREPDEPTHVTIGTASVWWQWTAPVSRRVVVDTCGSAFHTTLAVYTGDALGALTHVASNDGGCGSQSRLAFHAVAGQTYRIAVDGIPAARGAVALKLVVANNDDFVDAFELTGLAAAASATNVAAGREANEPTHARAGSASMWWRWTAPDSRNVTLDTCASTFDTMLAVYTGDNVGGLSPVAASDDACGDDRSRVTFAATAGVTYAIAVDGFAGAVGDIALALSAPPPPVNDDFLRAAVLSGTGASVQATNVGAGRESQEPFHVGVPGGPSVWWRWTAPRAGKVTVSTCGSSFETLLAVYEGTALSALDDIAVDDGLCGARRAVTFTAVAGATYGIAVDGVSGETGDIALTLSSAAPPAAPPGQLVLLPIPIGAPGPARAAPTPPAPGISRPGCDVVGGRVVHGTSRRDVLRGTAGSDILFGKRSGDSLNGLGGADCLYGQGGADVLTGGRGNDRLFGGDADDRLTDAHGRDTLAGGAGNDTIDARDSTSRERRRIDDVRCGPGVRDRALVDRRDRVSRDCEIVRRGRT